MFAFKTRVMLKGYNTRYKVELFIKNNVPIKEKLKKKIFIFNS